MQNLKAYREHFAIIILWWKCFICKHSHNIICKHLVTNGHIQHNITRYYICMKFIIYALPAFRRSPKPHWFWSFHSSLCFVIFNIFLFNIECEAENQWKRHAKNLFLRKREIKVKVDCFLPLPLPFNFNDDRKHIKFYFASVKCWNVFSINFCLLLISFWSI